MGRKGYFGHGFMAQKRDTRPGWLLLVSALRRVRLPVNPVLEDEQTAIPAGTPSPEPSTAREIRSGSGDG